MDGTLIRTKIMDVHAIHVTDKCSSKGCGEQRGITFIWISQANSSKFYNTGQCLLRFPAIIMPGVVGFDFMKNDSGGVAACKSTSVPENKQCHPD